MMSDTSSKKLIIKMNKGFDYAVRHPMWVAEGSGALIRPVRDGTTMFILVFTHIQSLTGPGCCRINHCSQ
jgi:hypothetical protein